MVVAVVTPRSPIAELDPRTNTIKLTREGFLFLDQLNRQVTDIAAAIIINTITDGITDQAPSSNAVFDAITTINNTFASYTPTSGLVGLLIEDAINNGITDKAPTENAVFDALAPKISTALTLTGSVAYDPPSLLDGTGTTTTVTVNGAVLGDIAMASFSLDTAGITITAWVSLADTVSVRFQNESGGTLDIGNGTLLGAVLR